MKKEEKTFVQHIKMPVDGKTINMTVDGTHLRTIDAYGEEHGMTKTAVRNLAFATFVDIVEMNANDLAEKIKRINPRLDLTNPQLDIFTEQQMKRSFEVTKAMDNIRRMGFHTVNSSVSDVNLKRELHRMLKNGEDIGRCVVGSMVISRGVEVDAVMYPTVEQLKEMPSSREFPTQFRTER